MAGRTMFLAGVLVGALSATGGLWAWRTSGHAEPVVPDATEGAAERATAPAPPRPAAGADAAGRAADPNGILARGAPDLSVTPDETAFLRKALLEERRRAQASRIRAEDSGLDVLRRVLEERADPADLLGDFDRFASHVHAAKGRVARFAEPAGGATLVLRDSEAKGAAVLEFGPGRFVLDAEAWGPTVQDVPELEIRGAGKDRTTLVLLRDLLMATSPLAHLRVHDLSIETREGQTLDVRAKAAAIFEDVRFVAWVVAGHAAPIGVSGQGYLGLRRCELFGGGARQGFGISLRGPALVLAEECTFADVEACVIAGTGTAGGSVVRFTRCRFLGSPLADSRVRRGEATENEIELHVAGGDVLLGAKELPDEERRRKWGVEYAASLEGVTFGPDPDRPTLGSLLAVLDAAQPLTEGLPMSISFVSAERLGQPASYLLCTWDGKSDRPAAYAVRMQGGRATVTREPRSSGPRVPKAGELDGIAPLSEILRRAEVPSTTEAGEIELSVDTRMEKKTVQVKLLRDRRPAVLVDALTNTVTWRSR